MRSRRLSGFLFAISLFLTAAGIFLLLATGSGPRPPEEFGFPGFGAAYAISFSAVGWLVTGRQPANVLGWLFTAVGLLASVQVAAEGYAVLGIFAQPGSLPGAVWAAWLYAWVWAPAVIIAGVFVLLLFPDGQLPSPRWRAVAWAGSVLLVLFTAGVAFAPGPLSSFTMIENPAGIDLLPRNDSSLVSVVIVGSALVFAAAALSLFVRYRRSTGATRQQLKWIAYAGGMLALLIVPTGITVGQSTAIAKLAQALLILAIAGIAIAAGIAVLRYRLYDIDLLINRTVLYGSVTVALAAAFGIANVTMQRMLEAVTGQRSELLTGVLGAMVAIAYGPVRRRTGPLVDRLLPARAVLALLFTDIVGSTERIVELGDERWRTLLDRYRGVVRAELGRYDGREVNTAGDAFFAVFDRPLPAVRCAQAIRAAVERLGLESRTGVHLGEVELRGEQVSGLAVHAAARVMAEARPGQILISDAMRVAVGDGLPLVDLGQHELKGLPDPWQLYAVQTSGD